VKAETMGGKGAEGELELPRRLQRLVRALPALCVLVFAAGVASIAYFPTDNFSSNTYLSENALLPAVADSTLSPLHLSTAVSLTAEYQRHLAHYSSLAPAARPTYTRWKAQWIREKLIELGLDDVHMHAFRHEGKEGMNVIGVVKARRTSGREALVLSSRNDHFLLHQNLEPNAVSSMAMGMAIMQHLSEVKWLSKDVMFVVTEQEHGDEGMRAWLHEYHAFQPRKVVKVGGEERYKLAEKEHTVHRGGKIRGALVLDFVASHFSYIVVCAEGVGGKLPNLDLLNTIDRVAAYGEQVYTTLLDTEDLYTRLLYSRPEFVELSMQLRTLLLFMLHSASGTSTGDHGWFHKYNIDAVTLRLQAPNGEQRHGVVKLARTVEGTVHSLSNLIEHLHQSFYYYLLSATFRYVSIGQYLVPFFAMLAAALAVPVVNVALAALAPGAAGVDILRALCRSIVFSLFGVTLYFSASRIPFLAAYGVGAAAAVAGARQVERAFGQGQGRRRAGYAAAAALLPSAMFLAPYALLRNFSFCFLAAAVFYPLVIAVVPVKGAGSALAKAQGILACALSLPVVLSAVVFVMAAYDPSASLQALVDALHHVHLRYSSLLYPFLCLVYAPTNLSFASWNLLDI